MVTLGEWQSLFQRTVELLAPAGASEVHRFWVLFISGNTRGEGAWFWIRSFRHLYILHLLVLSGSQIEALSRFTRMTFDRLLPTTAAWGGLATMRARLLRPALTTVLLAFASATGWSAPITRATVIGVLGLWFARWSLGATLLLAFFLQWILFREHRLEIGFYLSWIAYLVVVAMGLFEVPRLAATALVSGILFVVVDTAYFGNPFQIHSLVMCVAMNLLFCTIFDFAFMSLAAVFIAMALGLSVLALFGLDASIGGEFLALWTKPMVEALLVVLKSLMYT